MELNSLHILLTYQCNYECDHCFVWGSPNQTGIFTLSQLEEVFRQALAVPTIGEFYFEGGETFIYHPVLVKAVWHAHDLGFATGIVTNGYWATSLEDAWVWLRPLRDAGLDRIEISYDELHGDENITPEAHPGMLAARQLGLPANLIIVDPPTIFRDPEFAEPGEPLTGGGVMFRGRAAVRLTDGLPRQPWDSFKTCPYEDLVNPGRLHLDPLGNLHLCQGVVMGNVWERPLAQIIEEFDPYTHPIIGPLLAGGPAQLVHQYELNHEAGYVDACHLCYTVRDSLRDDFPAELAPDQMYGAF
jgi:hypothetical protein